MRILHGYIEEGESFADAVCRVACLAGQNKFDGYEIRCRECDTVYPENFMCRCLQKEYQELLNIKTVEALKEGGWM